MRLSSFRAAGVIVAGLGLLCSYLGYRTLQTRNMTRTRAAIEIETRRASEKMQTMLEMRVWGLVRMARHWEVQKDFDPDQWNDDAALYENHLPGFEGIGWLDHHGIVRGIVPPSRQSFIGVNLFNIDAPQDNAGRRKALLRALRTHTVTLSPIVTLMGGSHGFLAFVPIGQGERRAACIYAVFRLDTTLDVILGDHFLAHFTVYVQRNPPPDAMAASAERRALAQQFNVNLFGQVLRFEVLPNEAQLLQFASPLASIVLVSGTLLWLLLGYVTWLLQMMRHRNEIIFESDMRQKAVFDGAAQSIIGIDTQGTIRLFNRGAERMLGYSAAEMIGKATPIDLYDDETLDDMRLLCGLPKGVGRPTFDLLVGAARRGQVEQREINYRRKDGTAVPVLLTISAVKSRGGEVSGYVGIATDISTQRATQRALLSAKLQTEEASRLRTRFFAQMSHEIRTPLNGILGMTDLLLHTELTAEQRKYAGIVAGSGQSLIALINDILDLSKLEAGKLQLESIDFDPVKVIEDQTEIFVARAGEKKVLLFTHIEPRLSRRVHGDPSRLGQVLLNLISNAVKFTNQGIIVVRAEIAAHDASTCTLRFAVEDSGVGLADEVRQELFKPFMQGDTSIARKYGGTGLGLTICRQLVELWGGTIDAANRPEGGARFFFDYRLGLSEPLRSETDKPLEGMRAMIISNVRRGAEIGVSYLRAWGAQVAQVDNIDAAEAYIEAAAARGLPIEAATLSQFVAAQTPNAAARLRRAAGPHKLPLALVTTYDYRLHRPRGVDDVEGLMTLPVRMDEMLACFRRLRRGETYQCGDEHRPVPKRPVVKSDKRILVVDDNAVNRTLALALIESFGFIGEAAIGGVEALDMLQTRHFDLVLMDCQMPEVDGYEATRRLRVREQYGGGHLPIIALTAQALSEDEAKCLAAGMDAFVTKPIQRQHLEAVLSRWLHVSAQPAPSLYK